MKKEWIRLLNETIDLLEEELKKDAGNFTASDGLVCWEHALPQEQDEQEDSNKSPLTSFRKKTNKTLERVRIVFVKHDSDEVGPFKRHITVDTLIRGGIHGSYMIPLRFLDRFSPTVRRLNKFIRKVALEITNKNFLMVERHLSDIFPNRLDTILLGKEKDEKGDA